METKIIAVQENKINAIKELIKQNNNVNLILDLQGLSLNETDLEGIFKFRQENKENGTIFVAVKENVDFDVFSEEWNIVPTIDEAKDLISLEQMMRDLE